MLEKKGKHEVEKVLGVECEKRVKEKDLGGVAGGRFAKITITDKDFVNGVATVNLSIGSSASVAQRSAEDTSISTSKPRR